MDVIPRFLAAPARHFFLHGPHGSGKTTWCGHVFPNALRIDLLDPRTFASLHARPGHLAHIIEADAETNPGMNPGMNPARVDVVVDEIQRVPQLLPTIRDLIDGGTPQRFILTMPSATGLRCPGIDLLSGRAAHLRLHPYMAAELGERFELGQAMRRGMLPVAWATADPDIALHTCNHHYLYQELKGERRISNIHEFSRFLEAMSLSHAAALDLSCVARKCRVRRRTVEAYMDILEDLLLGFRLPRFVKRTRRVARSKCRFYFFDTGIYRVNRPGGLLGAAQDFGSATLKGLVAQHLRAWCDYSAGGHRLYHWQTDDGREVNFIVYAEDEVIHAIDVKASASLTATDLDALRAFGAEHPGSRRYLLYRGPRIEHADALCLPCEDFLARLRPDDFPQ